MRIRRQSSTSFCVGVLVVAVLAGCGSNPGKGPGNGAGQATRTGPHSSAAEPVPATTTGVPTPDAAAGNALLAALTAIDPDLTVLSDTDVVGNAVRLCSELREGDSPATAVPATFSDVTLTAGQVQAVADAVENSFCPLDTTSAPTTAGS